MNKKSLAVFIFLLVLFFYPSKAEAATLTSASDTVSTSRPSASTTLSALQAANATQVQIYDNGSIFLASDSAVLKSSTGVAASLNAVTVASMSASGVPSANNRIVYFTGTASSIHTSGDILQAPMTAMHKIQFITSSAVPSTGKIVITFPGSADNTASPSASTFAFNNLASANIVANNATCGSYTISSPSITCNLSASINSGVTVTILVGCSAQSGGNCTTQVPTLINPTKTATAGTADTWNVTLKTQDTNSVDIDSAQAKIGTVESVQVQATVDPTLTVIIAGIDDNTNYTTGSSSCGSEVTNTGISATATTVNLGILSSGTINKAGQKITVSTNANYGYAITATSSGRLTDPATGFYILDANGGTGLTANDTPVAAVFPATGNAAFGISACGTRVPSGWASSSTFTFGSGAKASNPWNSGTGGYYATIASYTGGAVTSEVTVIRYAATIAATTPPGLYKNIFTYVVTPTF